MHKPPANDDLVRWETPFTDWKGLSTWVITESVDNFTVVVAPLRPRHPLENYPKYLVRFDVVVTFLCYANACAFDRGYAMWALTEKERLRSYEWMNSPWLKSYRGGEQLSGWHDLHHYLILGDDTVVEVISSGQAKIERVNAKRTIQVKHAF